MYKFLEPPKLNQLKLKKFQMRMDLMFSIILEHLETTVYEFSGEMHMLKEVPSMFLLLARTLMILSVSMSMVLVSMEEKSMNG